MLIYQKEMDWTADGNYGINIDYFVMASATILVA